MSNRIITFGEIMLRLSPNGNKRFVQADSLDVEYGGGEANVAVSLANFGMDSAFVTKLAKNEIGDAAINELRKYGVDTENVIRGGERIGIYYLEKGASQRASKVIYDRMNSSISTASPDEFDWNIIFKGASWFHFTGITPALSEKMSKATKEACKIAKEKGITVSCDLNYRKKLWSTDKAGEIMGDLMQYIDVLIANEEDSDKVFKIKADKTDVVKGNINLDGYKHVAKELHDRFRLKNAAITLRESISASDNTWSALLYDGKKYYSTEKYNLHIIDRVGGGDSFGAGLIYSLVSGKDKQYALEFAVAASALKHSIEGDFNHVSIQEVKTLMSGDKSGRVQR